MCLLILCIDKQLSTYYYRTWIEWEESSVANQRKLTRKFTVSFEGIKLEREDGSEKAAELFPVVIWDLLRLAGDSLEHREKNKQNSVTLSFVQLSMLTFLSIYLTCLYLYSYLFISAFQSAFCYCQVLLFEWRWMQCVCLKFSFCCFNPVSVPLLSLVCCPIVFTCSGSSDISVFVHPAIMHYYL